MIVCGECDDFVPGNGAMDLFNANLLFFCNFANVFSRFRSTTIQHPLKC